MSEVLEQPVVLNKSEAKTAGWPVASYLPAMLPIIGAVLMTLARIKAGTGFISDGALIVIALACYLTAAVFLLTNIYAPSSTAQRLGLWLTSLGVFFNLSSWGVRWIAARDHEFEILARQGGEMPWFFRYIPFANLYDLSIAFAFGAGLTTLLITRRKNMSFLGALSLPMISLILLLALFIGNDIISLQPILDSYWRPIHVGVASLSYGVALVCFAIAVLYLLKDGVKTESMAIWTSIFALAVIATIGGAFGSFPVFTTGTYRASTFFVGEGTRVPLPLRATIPYVGAILIISTLLLLGVLACFSQYLAKASEAAKTWGHRLLAFALVAQGLAITALVSQIKSLKNILPLIDTTQYAQFGQWVAEHAAGMPSEQIALLSSAELQNLSAQFIRENGSLLQFSLNANPVELASLITAFAGTLFVILFSFRTERIRESLPPLERLDGMMYKTASVTFALLAMLLITGAVWANESWGRYWAWDPKETGAFVAWLTYAAYLHTRIARGWTGRRSAYFAIAGFLFIVFTYLGVSYLLKGLHSYA
ncbi:MAG: cytochrome c biogenesis protein CcsA [Pyrinomonadaceae bacterium]|nr:cytochrome c biogenesis protein CcsA [Pyrinomonadaceae bacterium]